MRATILRKDFEKLLFADGRQVFVRVEPMGAEVLQGFFFSVATDVLHSERATLPLTVHHYWRVSKNLAAALVSSVIDEIFGAKTNENN